MLRLVFSADDQLRSALNSRLRGAILVDGKDDPDRQPMNGFDGFVVPLSPPLFNMHQFAEGFLSWKKHVLLPGHHQFNSDALRTCMQLAERNKLTLSVVNPDHYRPSRQLIRQALDAGHFGLPGLIRIHRWESGNPDAAVAATDLPAACILDIEITLWLMRKPPAIVFATAVHPPNSEADVSRTLQIHLGFAGGAMALIDYSNRLSQGGSYQSLSLLGSNGASYADDHQNMQLLFQGEQPRAIKVDDELRATANMLQDFVDAVSSQRDCTENLHRWETAHAVADAVLRSIASKESVQVEDMSA